MRLEYEAGPVVVTSDPFNASELAAGEHLRPSGYVDAGKAS